MKNKKIEGAPVRVFFIKITLSLALFFSFVLCAHERGFSQESGKVFTFGVVPQFTPEYIYQTWDPVLKELSQRLNFVFELKTYPNIPTFEKAFLRGELDFAYVNPYHAVMAKKAQGYQPILRDKAPLIGIIVVKRDSPYTSIEDLKGATIAFPAPNDFGASLYLRALLKEKFKIAFTPKYVKTHDNVYRHVVLEFTQAGGGVNKTFLRQSQEVKDQLRILYETPGTVPYPIIVHPRVPKQTVEAFIKTFLALSKEKAFADHFFKIQIPNPIEAAYNRDYRPLEKLNLEKYVVIEDH